MLQICSESDQPTIFKPWVKTFHWSGFWGRNTWFAPHRHITKKITVVGFSQNFLQQKLLCLRLQHVVGTKRLTKLFLVTLFFLTVRLSWVCEAWRRSCCNSNLTRFFSQFDFQNFWPRTESFGSQGFAVWDRNLNLEKSWRHDVVVFDPCLWESATLYTEKCLLHVTIWPHFLHYLVPNLLCSCNRTKLACCHAKSKFKNYNIVSSTFFRIQISISSSKALRAKRICPRSTNLGEEHRGKTHEKPVEKRHNSTSAVA